MEQFYMDDFTMLYIANLFNILSPGANVSITIRNSNTISRKVGIMTAMGIICSSSIRKGCTICGIGLIVSRAFFLFQLVKYIGSLYLFYLGIQYLLYSNINKVDKQQSYTLFSKNFLDGTTVTQMQAFRIGFFTDILNPQALFGFITIVSGTVRLETSLSIRFCYVVLLVLTSIIWYTLVAFLFSHPLLTTKFYKFGPWIQRLTGFNLICIASKMLFMT